MVESCSDDEVSTREVELVYPDEDAGVETVPELPEVVVAPQTVSKTVTVLEMKESEVMVSTEVQPYPY